MALSEMQRVLLDMLEWFDAFCQVNGLRYVVSGGTMLGAVRHGGFIPWDDDVDVAMPRPDYQALVEAVGDRPAGRYFLETPDSPARDFLYPQAKLYDTMTVLTEASGVPCRRGVFMDIFPLDGMGATLEEATRRFEAKARLNKLRCARVCAPRQQRAWWKNAAIRMMRLVPAALMDDKELARRVAADWTPGDWECSVYVAARTGSYGTREVMPKCIFEDLVRYPFESLQVWGVRDAQAYLSRIYGDWRQLPPEDRRGGDRHDLVGMDLHHSYLDLPGDGGVCHG